MTTVEEVMLKAPAAQALADSIRDLYKDVRVLPDGSVAALGDLIYTRAIYLGCDRYGFERRLCYSDKELATYQFSQLQSQDDTPAGFIANR